MPLPKNRSKTAPVYPMSAAVSSRNSSRTRPRAMGRVTPAAEARYVHLEFTTSGALPSCETDASRVEQILVNLLGNAIHQTPQESQVVLDLSAGGVGSATPWATTGDGGDRGVGLGQPLSRRLARLLGGELRAEAAVDGRRGGRFVLELPAAVDREEGFTTSSDSVQARTLDSGP